MGLGPGDLGVDVSYYQESIHWPSVARENAFAFVKTTEGIDYRDPRWRENLRGSLDAGLLTGAYHFGRPDTGGTSSDAEAEARDFVACIGEVADPVSLKEWAGGKRGVLGILDFETPPYSASWARAWAEEYHRRTGARPVLYGYGSSLNPIVSVVGEFEFVWLAAYVSDWQPYYSGDDGDVWCWQFTDSSSVAGISGDVDRNRWLKKLDLEEDPFMALSDQQQKDLYRDVQDIRETVHTTQHFLNGVIAYNRELKEAGGDPQKVKKPEDKDKHFNAGWQLGHDTQTTAKG
jgi:GH25 family lysozyme M1 (1,4-beta-N-acetylmuramidase)